ncbi:ankyrin domain-containing protein [Coccidioides immitis H538.4]|uniref:Ankyrin domain-containing protein n=1 Tax=Coccidioides immitis H538.4 TaxID=396776 RepID=A0A0J8RXW1_COCIT|nr:ankyrin domain-containing protein [Coccidioides immitis H538.4]
MDKHGWSTLHHAAVSGNVRVIDALLKKGDVISLPNGSDDEFTLHKLVRSRRVDLVEAFLEAGADMTLEEVQNLTAFDVAIETGQASVVDLFLSSRYDPSDIDGFSLPLHRAVSKGDEAIVSLLIDSGADVHSVNTRGMSALHLACIDGYEDIVDTLMEWDADPDLEDEDGWSPLMHALHNGYINIAELMIGD